MKIKDIITLAFETVLLYRFRSFLSILGITIGVMAIVSGAILGLGSRESIMQQMARSGADMLWFHTRAEERGIPTADSLVYKADVSITGEDIDYIKKQCSLISEVGPYLYSAAVLWYENEYHTIKALGLMSPFASMKSLRIETSRGRFINENDVKSKARVCVVEESDFSRKIFGRAIPVGRQILIGEDKYRIVGSAEKMVTAFGYPERLIVLFPSTSLQETVGSRRYSNVIVMADEIAAVPQAREQLRQALAQRFGPSKFNIAEYAHHVQTAMEILSLLNIILVGLGIISLSVGGVGIMNVMMAMVTEQTREIGIAKAVGASRGSVLFLFIIESSILTVFGGITGVLLGILASRLVTAALSMPFIVPAWAIMMGFSLSLGVGIISGTFPAKRAAELDPIVALRM